MDRDYFEIEVELDDHDNTESENEDGKTIVEEDDGYCD